jgi:hypothetical protein
MKINIRLSVGELFYIDTVNLYDARHRKAFLHAAADECRVEPEIIKRDLGRILLKLEELQEKALTDEPEKEPVVDDMTDGERAEALALLRSPQLLERIAADFETAGLVGETANALVACLAAVSRLTDDPLAVIIQSSSSAGKSSLMDAVLAFMPDEQQIRYTAMTGQSLFYMGETELAHKILAISEEEGAEQAGYALKILQSEKRLRIASTGKDPKTGRLITQEYLVEGPAALFMTTTSTTIDEELQNRCIVLTVNEARDQTRRIHEMQRQSRTLNGLLRKEQKKTILRVHQNAQRLLRPLLVVNPYAEQLTFADARLRTRRDHMKYLNLINAIALLHQHQRPVKWASIQQPATSDQPDEARQAKESLRDLPYIEVTLADIDAANRLASTVLGTSLDDLPPHTRRLLEYITDQVRTACQQQAIEQRDYRFTRRDLMQGGSWGNTQLKMHLARLVDHEYLAIHPLGSQRFAYELLYQGEGRDGQPFLMNLIDTASLRTPHHDDANRSGLEPDRSAPGRGVAGPQSAPAPTADLASHAVTAQPQNPLLAADSAENHIQGPSLLLAAEHRTAMSAAADPDRFAEFPAVRQENTPLQSPAPQDGGPVGEVAYSATSPTNPPRPAQNGVQGRPSPAGGAGAEPQRLPEAI